jgi:response regulator RpfG family c-di-GMP phosphodiesterase
MENKEKEQSLIADAGIEEYISGPVETDLL